MVLGLGGTAVVLIVDIYAWFFISSLSAVVLFFSSSGSEVAAVQPLNQARL